MKKIIFIAICSVMAAWTYAQEITDVTAWEILASDDFEGRTPWISFDAPGAGVKLNNALGGTQTYSWANYWGGACIQDGRSAVSGNKCLQLHWGGTLPLQGFEINPAETYKLEVAVHPAEGVGDWNNNACIHLFVFDNSDTWQSQGIRFRISNTDLSGPNPCGFDYDVWEGVTGTGRSGSGYNFSAQLQDYMINDAADPSATNYWLPVKMIFKGSGTVADPIIIDIYLNDTFVTTLTFNDIFWKGDSMIGLQRHSAGDNDVPRFDNFKLSVATSDQGSAFTIPTEKKLVINQPEKGQLTINYSNANATYKLYNVAGIAVVQGALKGETTTISTRSIPAGAYILQLTDKTTGTSQSLRTILK